MLALVIAHTADESDTYRREKYAAFAGVPEFHPALLDFLEEPVLIRPQILERAHWPALSDATLAAIDERIACFLREVNERSPLLHGETLSSDAVSRLEEPFLSFVPGTPVLRRETSHAVLYYLKADVQVSPDGSVAFAEPPATPPDASAPPSPAPPRLRALGGPQKVVLKLAMALLEGILGAAGAAIFDSLFPGTSGFDQKQLLEDFARVVKNANTQQTVHEQAGKMNGVLLETKRMYLIRKADGAPEEELRGMLKEYYSKVHVILGILSDLDFQKAGLPIYVAAAEIAFTLYQELAFLDADPSKSSAVRSLTKAVIDDSLHVRDVATKIVNDNVQVRMDRITPVQDNPFREDRVSQSRFYFRDSETNYFSGYYGNTKGSEAYARCTAARNAYAAEIRTTTKAGQDAEVQWIRDCVDKWQGLLKQPLPPPLVRRP